MPTYFLILSSVGIIFGLGHFYFGYVYHIKRTSLLITSILLVVAILINFILYTSVFALSPPLLALGYFYLSVLFLFVLHHSYDMYRFGFIKQCVFWFLYGVTALYLTYSQIGPTFLGPVMIWSLVFYHYVYWIYLACKKMGSDRRRVFLKEVAVVHLIVVIFYFVGYATESVIISAVYSFTAFHHLTSVHIIFSTIKELSFLKRFAG